MATATEVFEKYGIEFEFVMGRMVTNAKSPEDVLRGLIGFAEGVGDSGYAEVFRKRLETPDGDDAR